MNPLSFLAALEKIFNHELNDIQRSLYFNYLARKPDLDLKSLLFELGERERKFPALVEIIETVEGVRETSSERETTKLKAEKAIQRIESFVQQHGRFAQPEHDDELSELEWASVKAFGGLNKLCSIRIEGFDRQQLKETVISAIKAFNSSKRPSVVKLIE